MDLVCAAVAALLWGCGDERSAEGPPDVELTAATLEEAETLGAVNVAPRLAPALTTIDARGGTVTLGPVSAVFDPDAVEDTIEVGLLRAAEHGGWAERWGGIVRPTGTAFSLVTRGAGAIRAGRITVALDTAPIPEGWEPQVIVRSAARACGHASAGRQDFRPRDPGPNAARAAAARADELRAGRFGSRPREGGRAAEVLAFACISSREAGRLELPITAGDAPGDDHVFEVVLTKGLRHEHVVDDGRLFACVHYVSPPADGERYHATLVAALKRARNRARELGLSDPPHPLSITIVEEIKTQWIGGEHLQGVTSGTRMALRSDLLAQWPRGEPSQLDYVVAHEYFHVVQAFSMTLDTYNASYNDWALEGGAEWFAHTLFDNFRESWEAPLRGLEEHAYESAPFWMYLADRFGERVMVDVLTLLRERALGGRRFRDRSLQVAFGLRLERSSFTEALDRVLHGHGSSLSEAWGDFSIAYLYRRTFQSGDQGSGEKPGLWYGLEEHEVPLRDGGPWVQRSLFGATFDYPVVLEGLTARELSGAALRLTERFDRGTLHFELQELRSVMGAMGPSPCRELGAPRLRVAVYGEKAGEEPVLLSEEVVGEQGLTRDIESFGRGGDHESAVVVLVNEGWRMRSDCADSASETQLTEMRDVGYRLIAYLRDREVDRTPGETQVTPRASGKVWGVSKHRTEDEDGNRCFGTFSAAINNKDVKDGHELIVDPDVYEEPIVVTKALTIRARVPGTVKILVPRQQAVTVVAPDSAIVNMTLIGGQSMTSVVDVRPGAHNAYVCGNVIVSGGPGISAREAAAPIIAGNWIAATQAGIRMDRTDGAVVERNVIAPPVAIEGLTEPDVSGRRIEVPAPQPGVIDSAIQVVRSKAARVVGNESITWSWNAKASFDAGLTALDAPGLVVRGNLFRSSNGPAVSIGRSAPVDVGENLLAGSEGLVIFESGDVTARGNVVEARFKCASLTQVSGFHSAGNRFIAGDAAMAWALELRKATGVTCTEDVFDGWQGGGLGASQACSMLTFERCRFLGVDTCAQIEDSATVAFRDCTFTQVSQDDHASDAGDGAALVLKETEAVLVSGARISAPGLAVYVEGCTTAPWRDVRLAQAGHGGIFVVDTTLALEDVALHPRIDVPLVAERGEIRIQDLRFAYADGEPLLALNDLSLAPGLLARQDLAREVSIPRTTPLLPWWWEVHARDALEEAGIDASYYRLRFEVDLERTSLPVALGAEPVVILSYFGSPFLLPVEQVREDGGVRALRVDIDQVDEKPDERGWRKFTLMVVPRALLEER